MKESNLERLLIWILAAFALVFAVHAHAGDFPEITAEQLKAKMDAGEELLLVNPLSDIEFQECHIPGSVNIPVHTILITDELPKKRNHLIITYCHGLK